MPPPLRKIIIWIILLLGTALFCGLLLIGTGMYFNSAPAAAAGGTGPIAPGLSGTAASRFVEVDGIRVTENTAYLEVRKGESARSVGRRLEQAGLIRNRYFWQMLNRIYRDYLKSGYYQLEIPATQLAIRNTLVTGSSLLTRVTIPEGSTLKKTARILEDNGVCPADEFLAAAADPAIISRYHIPGASMEGYLFPDTYLFPPEYPAARAVETMADTFFRRFREIGGNTAGMEPAKLDRIVIIASIVEREYRVTGEAAQMAGVFYNRLGIGMALQSCATVEYVITEVQGRPHPEVLSTRDTEIRHPYNTYVFPGLPPGPICAPGEVALRAALYPAESSYLYFRLVNPASGRHYFSRTLDDHIKAGLLYVKGRG
jgi:UPF0755 protein